MSRTAMSRWYSFARALGKALLPCLLFLALAERSAGADATAPTELFVGGQQGLLSIKADRQSWTALLEAIHSHTGMLILAAPPPGSVTLTFRDLPVKQALHRLFGPGISMILYYPAPVTLPLSASFPAQAWILPKASKGRLANGRAPTRSSRRASANHPGQDDWSSVSRFFEMAYAGDPAARIYALSELAGSADVDEHIVLSALWDALSDQDINVKTYAIQTLIKRSGADALRYAWLALQDPNPAIRMLAIEGARTQENAMPLLQQALLDEDGGVRALAAALLKTCLKPSPCAG